MSGDDRAVLVVDGADGYAIRLTGGGPVEPETDPDRTALPAGVFHLLTADSDVASTYGGYVTVCGELVRASGLPPSCCPEGDECDRDPRYCPACVREAARWNAEAGDRASEAVDHRATR